MLHVAIGQSFHLLRWIMPLQIVHAGAITAYNIPVVICRAE